MLKRRWPHSGLKQSADSSLIAEVLCEWYRANRRDLPWRVGGNAYAVAVSEFMLQQTQVKTVLPYFAAWMERFPTVESLAAATEDEVLSAWQGLGYYRRARNLQAVARRVTEGGWPRNRDEWRAMPGVGDYTAAAIASIALGERVAVVDGNVERVYARFCGDDSVGSALRSRAGAWAQGLLDSADVVPGDFNQGLMELGATVCTPRKPSCSLCPISSGCVALNSGQVEVLPTPVVKRATVELVRYGLAFVSSDGRLALRKIPPGEWWEGMWTLPWVSAAPESGQYVGKVRHTVTHHRITFHVYAVDSLPDGCSLFDLNALPALPSLQRKAIGVLLESRQGNLGL